LNDARLNSLLALTGHQDLQYFCAGDSPLVEESNSSSGQDKTEGESEDNHDVKPEPDDSISRSVSSDSSMPFQPYQTPECVCWKSNEIRT
jgi:hypothetical protein